jgi:integrase
MAKIALTDLFVRSISTDEKRLEIFDEKISGLVLRVSKQGRKTWVVRYRAANGRQPRFTLGTYPALTLSDARAEALKILAQTHAGIDPSREKKKAKDKQRSLAIRTFDDLAEAYLLACEKGEWQPKKKRKRKTSIDRERACYRRYLKGPLGTMLLTDITRPIVKNLLRSIVARGVQAQTIQVQAFVRQAYTYGIAEFEADLIAYNPATGFGVIGSTAPRTRVLNDEELRTFWRSILEPPLLPPNARGEVKPVLMTRSMGIALQLCILLLMRGGETAGMAVSEVDLTNAVWRIPASRMKGGQPHLVPLPSLSVALIEEALTLRSDPKSPYVFPSPRWKLEDPQPIRETSLHHAMVQIFEATKMEKATPHDLRRTGSTAMTSERLGISPFIRSKVLGHRSDTGGGSAVSMVHYDMNEYVADKRRALAAWQDLVLKIVENQPIGEGCNQPEVLHSEIDRRTKEMA